ncbi:MAG: response regulator [Bdellovibrionota bacterium]
MFNDETGILVVDDSATTRNLLVKHLMDLGFKRFRHAANGEEAWKCLIAGKPVIGVIFCDWNMPDMGGLELLKKVRANERMKYIPFVMVTSERTPEKVREAVEAGVSNYIVKPFDQKVIKEKLERTYLTIIKKAA